eukprot:m.243926 g.243926  ORF g.243926 m.243926 type:complete len:482 (+) comp28919_c0_seq1:220-1665(+)
MACLGLLLRPFRAIESVKPSLGELKKFRVFVETPGFLRYMLWRQAMVCFLLPLVLADLGWQIHDVVLEIKELQDLKNSNSTGAAFADSDYAHFTEFVDTTNVFLTFVEASCLACALYFADQWKRSRFWITMSLFSPFCFTYVQFAMPLRRMFQEDLTDATVENILSHIGPVSDAVHKLIVFYVGVFLYFELVLAIMWKCITVLGPSSLCVLPALFRGASVVKKMMPQSAEVGWIMRVTPLFFTPLIGFLLLLLVQITDSYWVMAATILVVMLFILPAVFFGPSLIQCHQDAQGIARDVHRGGLVRAGLGGLGLTCIVIYIATDNDAQNFILGLDPSDIIHTVLHFLVEYHMLTLISADWLVQLVISIHHARAAALPSVHSTLEHTVVSISDALRRSKSLRTRGASESEATSNERGAGYFAVDGMGGGHVVDGGGEGRVSGGHAGLGSWSEGAEESEFIVTSEELGSEATPLLPRATKASKV